MKYNLVYNPQFNFFQKINDDEYCVEKKPQFSDNLTILLKQYRNLDNHDKILFRMLISKFEK